MATQFQQHPELTGNSIDERVLMHDLEKYAGAEIFIDDAVWVDLRDREDGFPFVMKTVVVQVNAKFQDALVRIETADGSLILRRVEPAYTCVRTTAAIAVEATITA